MSNDSFLDMAMLTKQPEKAEVWTKIKKEKVFSKSYTNICICNIL